MFKKFLKVLGSFFLVLIILLVAVGSWIAFSSSNHEEKVIPYFAKNMPLITTWNIEQFKPLLTSEALAEFETERGQKVLKYFSTLGAPISFEEPEFASSISGVNLANGANEMVTFRVTGNFEKGAAILTITLAVKEETYKIQYIKVNSDVFLE